MNREPRKPQPVLDAPEFAIDSYLSSLLGEATESPTSQETAPQQVKAKVVEIRPAVKSVEVPQAVGVRADVVAVAKTQVRTVEIAKPADIVEESDKTEAGEPEQIIPDWGNQSFQSLLFTVRGMTMAVPLVALNSIAEWNQGLTLMPGQPDWCMGILQHRGDRVVVIDTAQLIMPERLAKAADDRAPGSHILIMGDGRFGLACDTLQNPVMLDTDSVRWRRGQGYRPWMAGTIIDKLSVLLDIDAVLKMVQRR
jgi:purine-binding chemotaxis protein CheW